MPRIDETLAVLATAALVPPIFYFHARAERASEQLAATESQLRPLRSVEARNNEHLAQIEEARKQVAALQGLVATKANWLEFLSDVQTRLTKVGDVWLERVQVVPTPAADPSATPPAADPATPAPVAPLKLTLTGRLLDVANPVSNVSPDSYERVKKLIDFTLVVNAARPL